MNNLTIFGELANERKRQDKKWGGPEHDDQHDNDEWCEYINERTHLLCWLVEPQNSDRQHFLEIAALAVAAIESIDRKND